jgi:hypothetical protein
MHFMEIIPASARLALARVLASLARPAHQEFLPLHDSFKLDFMDAEISRRMPAWEWRRLLEMRERATFLAGLQAYDRLIPPHFSHNTILNKVVTEAQRFEMLVYALYLYDTRNPDDPRSGLTLAILQRLCVQQNCASRGRVSAILGIMRLGGYLASRASEQDSRVKYLVPTQAFIEIVEAWNRAMFEIIDAAAPGDNLVSRHAAEKRFGWDMRTRGGAETLAGWHLLHAFEEVAYFVVRDGGWMLLLRCVAESFHLGGGREIAPVCIDLQGFGKSFGVSRSHLRRLLEDAHGVGLLKEAPRNGSNIVLSQKIVASFLTCMASEFAFYRANALGQPGWIENEGK